MKYKKLLPLLIACVFLMLSACTQNQTSEIVTKAPTSEITTILATTDEYKEVPTTDDTEELTTASISEVPSTQTTQKLEDNTSTSKKATTKPSKAKVTTKHSITLDTKETTSKVAKTTSTTTSNTTTTKATTKVTTTAKKIPICTLTIECTDILSNKDKLKAGHEAYVPSSGYVLRNYKVEYKTGDTAYDILKKGCDENSINLTASNTAYGTYVSGINNLDEFDCGNQSGWLYSVNSTFPSVSCSKKTVNENDNITFQYTCEY